MPLLSIVLNVSVSERIIKAKNITAFINNQAANTVILGERIMIIWDMEWQISMKAGYAV